MRYRSVHLAEQHLPINLAAPNERRKTRLQRRPVIDNSRTPVNATARVAVQSGISRAIWSTKDHLRWKSEDKDGRIERGGKEGFDEAGGAPGQPGLAESL